MMKKLGFSMLVLLVLASVAVFASNGFEDEVDFELYDVGDIDYSTDVGELGWWDKLRLNLAGGVGFTLVGDATCSVNPDKSTSHPGYTPSSSTVVRYCYTNRDYQGVVWQMFSYDPVAGVRTGYEGQLKIIAGDKKCFNVDYGEHYVFDLYVCDLVVERECSDTDGGNFYRKGTVEFSFDGDSGTFVDACYGDRVYERICDADDTPVTIEYECKQACEDGACVVAPVECVSDLKESCSDGSSITVVKCVDGKKVDTGEECPVVEPEEDVCCMDTGLPVVVKASDCLAGTVSMSSCEGNGDGEDDDDGEGDGEGDDGEGDGEGNGDDGGDDNGNGNEKGETFVSMLKGWFDFKNEPLTAYGISALLIIIVFGGLYLIIFKNSNGGKL